MLRLYTDESPGLKVDPVVVLVLSLVFIFSVVALHSMLILPLSTPHCHFSSRLRTMTCDLVSSRYSYNTLYLLMINTNRISVVIAKITRRFSS
jgi:hypothetical protein